MARGARPPERGGLLFIAWGAIGGRSSEIASSLGGRATCLFPPGSLRRPPALVRYARSTLETLRLLAAHRPDALIVTNPPVIPGLIGLGWSRLAGIPIALDSHPGSFGAMEDRSSARMIPVHRWLARRVDLSLVAAPAWQAVVESCGARAMVVHEAPSWRAGPAGAPGDRFRVLYVGTFAGDEPVEAVCAAAALLPDCDVLVTGDPAEAPAGLVESAPANVSFVGFLDTAAYRREVERADLVVALTTEPGSVMRAAYEAVYAERPLVVSDWPLLRELFPAAVHARNEAESLAAAVLVARAAHGRLVALAGLARATQVERFEAQRLELAARLGLSGRLAPGPGPSGRSGSPGRADRARESRHRLGLVVDS